MYIIDNTLKNIFILSAKATLEFETSKLRELYISKQLTIVGYIVGLKWPQTHDRRNKIAKKGFHINSYK